MRFVRVSSKSMQNFPVNADIAKPSIFAVKQWYSRSGPGTRIYDTDRHHL